MAIINEQFAIIQPLSPTWHNEKVATIAMLRLDRIHPTISGNKWYKLQYNLQTATTQDFKSVLTFGGAYSNHLVAAAATAQAYRLASIGIVRGTYTTDSETETLKACREYGMELVFVSYEEYAQKTNATWLAALKKQYNNPYIIPEGGANKEGVLGAGHIAQLIPDDYTHICISVGTGTTLTGLRETLPIGQAVTGFAPMKGGNYIADEITSNLSPEQNTNWQLFDRWHFGGFGKWNDELIAFMNEFYAINSVPLDMVYTAKMMYGVQQLLSEGYFPTDARILCIHTGGLQGNASIGESLSY